MTSSADIPEPLPTDHGRVHSLLSTAQGYWAAGEHDEGVRWLRKAVAAAVASDDDARAMELGRRAAELEAQLSAVSTKRGAEEVYDDLDAPTFVESSRRLTPICEAAGIEDEVTNEPFTLKTAPQQEDVTTSRQAAGDPQTPPQGHAGRGEPAGAGRPSNKPPRPAVSRTLDLSEVTSATRPATSSTLPASSSTLPDLSRWRVALLATADDDHPRVMYLRPGMEAPAGAAVAYLFPASDEDGRLVASLLLGRS